MPTDQAYIDDTAPAPNGTGSGPAKPKADPKRFVAAIAAEFKDASEGVKRALLSLVTACAADIATPGQANLSRAAEALAAGVRDQRQVSQAVAILEAFARIADAGAGLSRQQVELITVGVSVGLT